MKLLTLDFETYFDSEYTLKKMTTEAYIRDPRFMVHGCGLLLPDGQSVYVPHSSLPAAFSAIDWDNTAVLCHHAHFDGFILSHHFGIRPKFWLDTMCMARLVLGPTYSVALSALTKTFELSHGKTLDYQRMSGYRFGQDPAFDKEIGEGCKDDCKLTNELFQKLMTRGDGFPREELKIIDMTIRWFTEPVLDGDQPHYEWLKEKEWLTKNELLHALGVSEKELGSPAAFGELLADEARRNADEGGQKWPYPCIR